MRHACRYTLEQLERMVQTAEAIIPGTSEVIQQARTRRQQDISPNGVRLLLMVLLAQYCCLI